MDDRIIVSCILKNGKKELFSLIAKNYEGMLFSRSLEALNLMEKEKRKLQADLAPPDEEYSEERERLLQRMEEAIDEMPQQDRQIIRLHYYDKVKTEDIARRLCLSHSNVLVRLHRIRERLKKRLQDDND